MSLTRGASDAASLEMNRYINDGAKKTFRRLLRKQLMAQAEATVDAIVESVVANIKVETVAMLSNWQRGMEFDVKVTWKGKSQ